MSDIPPTRRGYDAREVVSAFQKSVRRSDADATLYWSLELVRSGFGPWWWKRARVVAVEDVSPEATGLIADLHALHEQWRHDDKVGGERNLYVASAALKLALAPKNRVTDWALLHHASDHVDRREVPDHALDKHTRRGRQMNRGWDHFLEEAGRLEPFAGSLDALEDEYRDRFRRQIERDPDLPSNPWAPRSATGGNDPDTRPASGQLRIEQPEGDDR